MSSTVEYIPGMNFGLGFNTATLDIHPVSAFENATSTVTPGDAGGQEVFYSIQIASNSVSLAEQLKTSASASLKYGVSGSGSAKASFSNSISQNSYTLYIIVSVTVANHLTTLDLSKCSFTSQAADTLRINSSNFLQQYGDSFVYGITSGGEFIGVLQMETSSSAELSAIKAKVSGSASYGLFSGSASAKFSQSVQEITSSYSLKGSVMRRGGSGSLVNMTAEDLVSAAIRFPKEVEGDKGYPYSAIVIPYSQIPHPSGAPLIAAQQASVLDQLGRIRERMLVYSNNLLVASERSDEFRGIDLDAVGERYQRVNAEIAKVVDSAKLCYAQASECKIPEIDFTLLEPILPPQGEKLTNVFSINYTHSELDRPAADATRSLTWTISASQDVLRRIEQVKYTLLSWYEDKQRSPGMHYPYLEWNGDTMNCRFRDPLFWESLRDNGFPYVIAMEPWRPRSIEVSATFGSEVVTSIWYNSLTPLKDGIIHSQNECPLDALIRQ